MLRCSGKANKLIYIYTSRDRVPSQFVLKSIRTHFGQFVLKILVNSYSFGQFVLMSGQFVLILVNSHSFWSIRTQTQMSTN